MIAKHVRNLRTYEPDSNFARYPARAGCDMITLPDGQTAYIQFIGLQKGVTASEAKQRLLGSLPLLRDEEIAGAPDGLYAWVYSSKGLIASPVFSKLEFGSRHFDILRRMEIEPDVELYGAGEFRKVGNKITYNIASGSITVQLMRKIDGSNNYMNENATSIAEKARNKFSTLGGIEVEYTGDAQTLIDMPLTFEQVKFYESLGYKIYYHKDEAKCKDPNFLEPSRISAKIDFDERMKTRMLGFAKNNPDKIAEVTEKYDALIEESKAKLRGYLYFVGGKQTRRRRTTRRRKSLKK